MKKVIVFAGGLIIGGVLFAAISSRLRPQEYENVPAANIYSLIEAESRWYGLAIYDYQVQVEISFGDERRMHRIQVSENSIAAAEVQYWDFLVEGWAPSETLSPAEAYYFTIPGLFETIRQALLGEVQREYAHCGYDPEIAYPTSIYLGRILQEDGAADGTALSIRVIEFVPLR